MAGELFKKYYSRLAKEGVLKSVLCGLICGFAVAFVISAIFWLTGVKLFWISILSWVAVSAAVAALLYFKKFKPTTKAIAMRVDELGLEERVLTMTELEGDESYIAMRQREDAISALSTVNAGLLTIIVSVPLIVATCVSAVFGVGMTTISALASAGVIKSGKDIIEEVTKEPTKTFELTYEALEGGIIEGELFQVVDEGEDGTPVLAVADDEWVFVAWSDGNEDPYRTDLNVTENMEIFATFQQLSEGDEGDGDEGAGDGDGMKPDKPGQGENKENGPPKPGDGAGGKYEPVNQIIDGKVYYGDEYEDAFEEVMSSIAQSGDLPKELKEFIENYFGSIAD
ncbi:MAG: hypothetical protein J6B56_01325 [Clostridia bacterium]|nr:hypothetical protein [Clostridia bacterium]